MSARERALNERARERTLNERAHERTLNERSHESLVLLKGLLSNCNRRDGRRLYVWNKPANAGWVDCWMGLGG